jgi:hypothetical protein
MPQEHCSSAPILSIIAPWGEVRDNSTGHCEWILVFLIDSKLEKA